MKNLSIIFATVLLFAGVTVSNAADNKTANHNVKIGISTHALVDIESTSGETSISLTPKAPTEAGLGLDFSNLTNDNFWLNYSSIVSSGNKNNSISVETDQELPTGMTLVLEVGEDQKQGKGKEVKVSENIELSTKAATAIDGIKSCYTGSGVKKGHNLKYTLKFEDEAYEDLTATDIDLTITYTITEN
jgi:hypothetical protein